MDKEKKIKSEYERLFKLFEGADENKLDFVREQLHQLAFLNITIKELQQSVNEDGTRMEYSNGANQKGLQTNPDLKSLIELEKLSNTLIRALLPIVPEKIGLNKLEEFLVN